MKSVQYDGAIYSVQNHESVLDALLRGGADVSFSCRKGSCQTCLLRAVEGEPGPDAQKGLRQELVDSAHFMPCVCHPDEDMVIAQPDLSQMFMPAMLSERTQLSPSVTRLRIEPARDLNWTPGQYINLRRDDGLMRSYSIASIAEVDYFLEVHVRRVDDGQMSRWIHDELAVGDFFEVQGPLGACTYREEFDGRPLILVGTGTGIAPLYGITRDALRHDHEGEIWVYHGGRTMDDLYLHAELGELADEHDNLHYVPCLSGDDVPEGIFAGRVTDRVFKEDHPDAAGHVLYLCGNPDMVYDARYYAIGAGVARADVLADPFESAYPYMPDDDAKLEAIAPDPELWEALDKGPKLRAILQDFYEATYEDPRLSPFFHNVTMQRAISKQYAFLAEVFSGEDNYFGLNPFNAHHWMIISDELFDYREELFEASVRKHGLPEHLVRRWMAFQELFRREIVKSTQRGLIMNGVEHKKEGFSVEEILIATICDGCMGEINEGDTARMHKRTGQLFCTECAATSATNEVGAPA
ncbi:2Fe-2S iron-sulfur cluster binding domain-containing protein [Persicimonas caeni]|uniref:2Fe-2S iron-sulfur cluster binding domain-containing protein n=1 Tax=Persicimonas caeni TaxID=2292766 RepID=A0A4Y6PSE6_PERCE|nr:FAD-binding oxidoreductase [Persicimonas caeni]QDG51264.1 2Fe-2S iron-sulfur cluster binding domain-containing protein [Persicimonas caeni]QED32485.1 2Fe-2S iron-sulfur cluster binding domain-containing protein [Persicimonas caeni]